MPRISSLPQTLGVRTDLAVAGARTSFEARAGYAVVRTPQNPGYYNGNYLLFPAPPRSGDAARWRALFDEAFACEPRVKHAAFCWDAGGGNGAAAEFTAAGYALDEYDVMAAESLRECLPPGGIGLRELRGDADWMQQLEMQLSDVPAVHDTPAYRDFKIAQIAHHREIAGSGGIWLGAFDGERLAGSCGIFPAGAGVARYQDVMVAQAFRNRGIARALVCEAGRRARASFGAHRLVVVADANDFARVIYRNIGFLEEQRESRLWKANRG